eukprot:209918-Lingulodinium_polyedra.AAC.1
MVRSCGPSPTWPTRGFPWSAAGWCTRAQGLLTRQLCVGPTGWMCLPPASGKKLSHDFVGVALHRHIR